MTQSTNKQEWWEEEFDKIVPDLKSNSKLSIPDKPKLAIKSFISRTLAEERRRVLRETVKTLKFLKLHFDTIVCECGEEWKDTDPAIFVKEKLTEIEQLKLKV